MSAPAELALDRRRPFREIGLWLGTGLVVLAAHGAFAYLLRDVGPVREHNALEQALEIDLAPLPVSIPETVQSEAVARVEPAESIEPVEEIIETVEPEPERVVEAEPETVREIQPEAEAAQEAAETIEPESEVIQPEPVETETVEAESDPPDMVEEETVAAVTPEVAIPLPQPRPEPPLEAEPEPTRKQPVRKKAEEKKKVRKAARSSPKTPPASQASAASRAPSIDPSRWNNAVRAAVARRAGAVRGLRGTVRISFVVDASGSILSARISASSGNDRLDRAALGMVRSARVPAPPAGLPGSRHAFAIPLTFR